MKHTISARLTAVLDVAERALLTYIEAFLGILLATQVTDLFSVSALQAAAVAAAPAGLAVIKGALGVVLGKSGSAAWLPDLKTSP